MPESKISEKETLWCKVPDLAAPRRKSRKEREAQLEAEKLQVEKADVLAKTVLQPGRG